MRYRVWNLSLDQRPRDAVEVDVEGGHVSAAVSACEDHYWCRVADLQEWPQRLAVQGLGIAGQKHGRKVRVFDIEAEIVPQFAATTPKRCQGLQDQPCDAVADVGDRWCQRCRRGRILRPTSSTERKFKSC